MGLDWLTEVGQVWGLGVIVTTGTINEQTYLRRPQTRGEVAHALEIVWCFVTATSPPGFSEHNTTVGHH